MINMLKLNEEYLLQKEEIDQAIDNVLSHSSFINGPEVQQFINLISNYLDDTNVITCGNGTDALLVALMSLDLPSGSEVILPAFTYIAPVEVVKILNLIPVLVDIDPDTFNIEPSNIESVITPRTRVIIPVHLFGQSCEMNDIITIARKHNLWVIEDNAQSFGASYKDQSGNERLTGTMGDVGCHSFFPTKNLACYGDGGAINTNSSKLAKKIKELCTHGQSKKYYHSLIGINSRLDTIQAAILIVKLKKLEWRIEMQRRVARTYDSRLSNIPIIQLPYQHPDSTHTYNQYCIKVKNGMREKLKNFLSDNDIQSTIYYPLPVHHQTAYIDLAASGPFPNAETVSHSILALPSHPLLRESEIDFICDTIRQFCKLNS